jgi:hypothetical protein
LCSIAAVQNSSAFSAEGINSKLNWCRMLPKMWGAPHKSIVRDDYENDIEEADRWLGRFERKVDPKLLHSG